MCFFLLLLQRWSFLLVFCLVLIKVRYSSYSEMVYFIVCIQRWKIMLGCGIDRALCIMYIFCSTCICIVLHERALHKIFIILSVKLLRKFKKREINTTPYTIVNLLLYLHIKHIVFKLYLRGLNYITLQNVPLYKIRLLLSAH